MRQHQSGGKYITIYIYVYKGQSRLAKRASCTEAAAGPAKAAAPAAASGGSTKQLTGSAEAQGFFARSPLDRWLSRARACAQLPSSRYSPARAGSAAAAAAAGTAAAAAAATRRQAGTATAAAGWGTEAPLLCFKAAAAPVTACHPGAPAFRGSSSSSLSLSSLHSLVLVSCVAP